MYLQTIAINQFHATGPSVNPLKTQESQRFSDVYKGNRKRPAIGNGSISQDPDLYNLILDHQVFQISVLHDIKKD